MFQQERDLSGFLRELCAAQPLQGLRTTAWLLIVEGSAPLSLQKTFATREAAAAQGPCTVETSIAAMDANDQIFQVKSSRTCDPWPNLEAIITLVIWINSADD